jgi:hypothetical protein
MGFPDLLRRIIDRQHIGNWPKKDQKVGQRRNFRMPVHQKERYPS